MRVGRPGAGSRRCPVAWVVLWLVAFGLFGPVHPEKPGAIPGWIALATAPALGILLGWVAPWHPGARSRTVIVAPTIPVVVAIVTFAMGGMPPRQPTASCCGSLWWRPTRTAPVIVGRLLRIGVGHPRSEPT